MIDLSLLPDGGMGWLDASGPKGSIVLSTRIRLARNLEGYVFGQRAKDADRTAVLTRVEEASAASDLLQSAVTIRLDQLERVDRQLLHERHLVSKELAGLDREARPRPGAALVVQGTVGVMVNEEDHLRLHGMRSGFALEDAYADLEGRIPSAFRAIVSGLPRSPSPPPSPAPPAPRRVGAAPRDPAPRALSKRGAARAAAGGRRAPAGPIGWSPRSAADRSPRSPPPRASAPRCDRHPWPAGRTRSPRDCGRAGCGWRGRCCPSARTRRASPCRRRGGGRGRSFEHPDAVAQLGGELEVFVLDGPPQLLLELEQLEPRVGGALRARRGVALAHVLAGAVQPAQQVAQVRREGVVTLRATQPSRLPEILERAPAGRAAQAIGGRRQDVPALPDHPLQKAAERRLEHRGAGLDTLLLRALVAQVERDFGVVLHLGQIDDRVALLAVVAQHQGIASTDPTAARRPSSSTRIRSARPASCRLCVTTTTAVSYSRASRKNTSCSRSELA